MQPLYPHQVKWVYRPNYSYAYRELFRVLYRHNLSCQVLVFRDPRVNFRILLLTSARLYEFPRSFHGALSMLSLYSASAHGCRASGGHETGHLEC